MPAFPLVTVTCPHCHNQVYESARLVRPLGNVYCPDCEEVFVLDDTDDATRRELEEARDARLRRKLKLRQFRARWTDPVPSEDTAGLVALEEAPPMPPATAENRPMLISDVLKTLDTLLDKLDAERRKGNDRAA